MQSVAFAMCSPIGVEDACMQTAIWCAESLIAGRIAWRWKGKDGRETRVENKKMLTQVLVNESSN
jgi:hypothetical protein